MGGCAIAHRKGLIRGQIEMMADREGFAAAGIFCGFEAATAVGNRSVIEELQGQRGSLMIGDTRSVPRLSCIFRWHLCEAAETMRHCLAR